MSRCYAMLMVLGYLLFATLGQAADWEQKGEVTSPGGGWSFTPSGSKHGKIYLPSEGYYPDKGGKWAGPYMPLPGGAFKFYRFEFEAQSPIRCFCAFSFYKTPEEEMVRDDYSSIFPSESPVKYEMVIYGDYGMSGVRPFFQSTSTLKVWNTTFKEITPLEAAAWCDSIYKTLPPLKYKPNADRLKYLPKTINALRSGKPWRILVLGHSLFSDTFNSNFQALLLREYPKAKVEFIWSGKGGTGCEYYKDHLQEYAYDYKPDMIILGAVDKFNKEDSVAQTVRDIKEKLKCEILLMTAPIHYDAREHVKDDRTTPLPATPVDVDAYFMRVVTNIECGPLAFEKKMSALADKEKVGFLDAAGIWNDYLIQSQKPWEWFHRDRCHGSDRGKQIVARMLETFFDEKK